MPLALLAALACAGLALVTAPATAAAQDTFPPPPPVPIVVTAALGRTAAATDLLWLIAVQRIGNPAADRLGHPRLELWIDEITELSPRFELPYAYAAVLMSADADRIDRIDAMLRRGEEAMPGGPWLPLQRAFLAYFGRGDIAAAVQHYRRAAQLGAPAYVAKFADRLERTQSGCAAMQADLKALTEHTAAVDSREAQQMFAQRKNVLENCVRLKWRQLESKLKLAPDWVSHDVTEEELVRAGMEPLPRGPGLCWGMDDHKWPIIVSCAGAAP